jgi:hypothetical protein
LPTTTKHEALFDIRYGASILLQLQTTHAAPLAKTLDERYAGGVCAAYITQWSDKSLWVIIKDASGAQLGAGTYSKAGNIVASSALPYIWLVNTGSTNTAPLSLSYAAQHWLLSDFVRCSQGGYSGGYRSINCAFNC